MFLPDSKLATMFDNTVALKAATPPTMAKADAIAVTIIDVRVGPNPSPEACKCFRAFSWALESPSHDAANGGGMDADATLHR